MKRLTPDRVRSLFPGAVETWVIDTLDKRQRLYAREADVLAQTIFWDDSGSLVLGWSSGPGNPSFTTTWSSKKLEWADDVDTLEFMSQCINLGS